MANLGFFEVNTNGEYKTIEEVTGLTFTTGTKYTMQIDNVNDKVFLCISPTVPNKGGFSRKQGEIFSYTPTENENFYIYTSKYDGCTLNISE